MSMSEKFESLDHNNFVQQSQKKFHELKIKKDDLILLNNDLSYFFIEEELKS